MAALAYIALPVSGLVAYFGGGSARVRFHGLQAILYGSLWPAALYLGALVSPGAAQLAALGGGLGWLALLVVTAAGLDPRLPFVGRVLERAATRSPRSSP